jgi:hypothetical protein
MWKASSDVGQPILAAAGFQPALAGIEKSRQVKGKL